MRRSGWSITTANFNQNKPYPELVLVNYLTGRWVTRRKFRITAKCSRLEVGFWSNVSQ
jgi:hypothetical protein